MPDPGSPWERSHPDDGFGYLPWPIKTQEDQDRWDKCAAHYDKLRKEKKAEGLGFYIRE